MSRDPVEHVVLVDERGSPTGTCPKLAAHENGGRRHLAFSILVWNEAGELLLQRRALEKYHFGGLWTNTCCGHPQPGADVVEAGERRLAEEFGFTTALAEREVFEYRAEDPESGLVEHELLHVLAGRSACEPVPNPLEIDDWRWVTVEGVRAEIGEDPDAFTPWFRLIVERLPFE